MLRVIIEVKGGVVQCVGVTDPEKVEVHLVDWDEVEDGYPQEDTEYDTTKMSSKKIDECIADWVKEVRDAKDQG